MNLPSIDFSEIADTAKQALAMYGSPALFFEQNEVIGRMIKAVIYRDAINEPLDGDLDSNPATAIVNPDDFLAPRRLPRKFDKLQITIGGFTRTYNIESAHPILAQQTLPLILVQLRAN